MTTNNSNTNCELKEALASNHSELVSGLQKIQRDLAECKEEKDKAREVEEQRRRATETHQDQKEQNTISLLEKMQQIMESKAAARRDSMRAAAYEPDGQRIIEEIQLHHAKVQNIVAGAFLTPQTDTRSLSSSSLGNENT